MGWCSDCCKKKEEEKTPASEITLPAPEETKSMTVVEMKTVCRAPQNIFTHCIILMHRFLGRPSYPFLSEPKQLYPYIVSLCGKGHEFDMPTPLENIQLIVGVRSAKIVSSKCDEFRRIHCKVSVGEQQFSTAVRNSVRELSWDKVFVIDVFKYDTDFLIIELWGHSNKRPKKEGHKTVESFPLAISSQEPIDDTKEAMSYDLISKTSVHGNDSTNSTERKTSNRNLATADSIKNLPVTERSEAFSDSKKKLDAQKKSSLAIVESIKKLYATRSKRSLAVDESIKKFKSSKSNLQVDSQTMSSSTGETSAEDQLLGEVRIRLRDLPCQAQDMLWPLHRGSATRGQVEVFVQLGTEKRIDHAFNVQMYLELMKRAYDAQLVVLHKSVGLWHNWLQILPVAALSLLQQHALQHGITPSEQAVCSWLMASSLKIHDENRISFSFLNTLLEGLSTVEVEPYLESALRYSLQHFAEHSKTRWVAEMHDHFDVRENEAATELYHFLRCISEIEFFGIRIDLLQSLQEECRLFSLQILLEQREIMTDEEFPIETVASALTEVITTLLRNEIILDDIFTRAWTVTYSSLTFQVHDEVMVLDISPIISCLVSVLFEPQRQRVVKESLRMLQLYHHVRNWINYLLTTNGGGVPMSCSNYSEWFGEGLILEWFLLCDHFTKPWIKRAALSDQMVGINKEIPHGTSIPDVVTILDEIVVDVWTKLNWEEQFYTHDALVSAIETCVLEYVDILKSRVQREGFFSTDGSFQINRQLCVALSNGFAILDYVCVTGIRPRVRRLLRRAEDEYKISLEDPFEQLCQNLQLAVSGLLITTLRHQQRKLNKLCGKVVQSTSQPLTSQSKKIAELCSSLDHDLEVFQTHLKLDPFYIILRQLWYGVVEEFSKALRAKSWCRKKSASMTSLKCLAHLQEVFYCEGRGLSPHEMNIVTYLELKNKIQMNV